MAGCPICHKASEPAFRPFCSRTCKDSDLLNWLGGHYAIPASETEDDTSSDVTPDMDEA